MSYDSLQVHPRCCRWRYSIHFYGWAVFHCLYLPHLFYSSIDGHLGCFQILATVNGAAVNIEVGVSLWIRVFIFPRYMPRSGVAGSHGDSSSVFKEPSYSSLSGCTSSHPLQQCRRAPISPHPLYHLWIAVFSWWSFWLLWDDTSL